MERLIFQNSSLPGYDAPMDSLRRRDFVALSAIAPAVSAQETVFFSTGDARWIDALMARIIPADDTPGAREAGCLQYLDKQLNGPLARFATAYRSGLQAFQQSFPNFLQAVAEEQDSILQGIEKTPFFEMLVDHTMQGFYGSPEHGGNREEASWKMLGIAKYMGGGHWHGA
ncbi:gluconate 2-dehydrogenase subunit 3 family protein [Bryobacter aggregatus]|uniref:gluconate 2-dehydrogenase subunit 3 family protein n=1 Tax=Bryobacter aggregatus TaxID=360054 RepID=UPI0004E0E8C9|nr:gluconate 2-dehydrogenase subunit 3 family protein [Bryobacter aggregatus]